MIVSWKRRFWATLASIVGAAAGLALSFLVFSNVLGEVSAARVGAASAVIVGVWLAVVISRGAWVWALAGVGVMAVLGAVAAVVTAALDATGEFLSLGLSTSWMAGVAVAVHAEQWVHRLGRLFLVGLVAPLLLIGGAVGFTFSGVGAAPFVGGLAALVPVGDVLSRVVANAGGGDAATGGSGMVDRRTGRREQQ